MMIADQFTDKAMEQLNAIIEGWLRHHLLFGGIVAPDRLGRFHRSQLQGCKLVEQVKDGWTNLALEDHGRVVARARYRWVDEELNVGLQWEPMPK